MKIVKTDYYKEVEIDVKAFAGMQCRDGDYGSISSDKLSNGKIKFIADLNLKDSFLKDAIHWFINESEELVEHTLKLALVKYLEVRPLAIESMDSEVAAQLLPIVREHLELKPLCGVVAIHIHGESNGGFDFGIEMGCNWEEEHGFGCLYSGKNIISIGNAEEAF